MLQLPRSVAEKCIYIPENAVDLERFNIPRDRVASLPIKVAFVGRLIPVKGADILIKAAREYLNKGQVELHFFGDGPERQMLEKLVDRLQVRNRVYFYGSVPHAQLQHKLRMCDVMGFPSIRDTGGGAVMEAMALGLMPIVADYAGPAEIVGEDTGVRVPFEDEKTLLEGLKRAIGEIVQLSSNCGQAGGQQHDTRC